MTTSVQSSSLTVTSWYQKGKSYYEPYEIRKKITTIKED